MTHASWSPEISLKRPCDGSIGIVTLAPLPPMRDPNHRSQSPHVNGPNSDDLADTLRRLQEQRDDEIESENRVRESFINAALRLADLLRPVVRALLFVVAWIWLVIRFIVAPLRGRSVRSVVDPAVAPPPDGTWQPDEAIFGPGGGQPVTTPTDELAQAAVRALAAWFGPASDLEVLVVRDGVIHARGPGYRFELRRSRHDQPGADQGWQMEHLDPEHRPSGVRLKAWRVVRLHDPVSGQHQGLWLLRGEPGPYGQAMPARAAGVAVRQLRFLRVTGSVFGRLGHMTEADKVDLDDDLRVLRGDPDMEQRHMVQGLLRGALRSWSRFNPDQIAQALKGETPFAQEMSDEQVQAEKLGDEKPARDVLMRANPDSKEQIQAWHNELLDRLPPRDKEREEM